MFEKFALVYDEVMDQEVKEQWLDFIQRHVGSERQRLLELACGTGLMATRLAQKGHDVTALDLSEPMLSVAHQRADQAKVDVQFVLGNMLDLSEMGTYQVITCLSDSICYLKDSQEVQQTFDNVYQALEPGGLFIFDVHSLYQINHLFADYSYHYQTDEFAFLWDSYPGEKKNSVEHFLTFFLKEENGLFSRYDELHHERTYEAGYYHRLLENANFSQIQLFGDFSDEAPTAETARWFFVCRKD